MKYCLEVFLFGEGLAGYAWKVSNVRTQPKDMSRRQGQEHWPEGFDTACVSYCYSQTYDCRPVRFRRWAEFGFVSLKVSKLLRGTMGWSSRGTSEGTTSSMTMSSSS